MQNTESQRYKCPRCVAQPGEPCLTVDGRVAEKVHYGRPHPPSNPRMALAYERAQRALDTSPLRPTPERTGIWVGSEFVSRDVVIPYGAWYCPCGEHRVALSKEGVIEMNLAYADHAECRERS